MKHHKSSYIRRRAGARADRGTGGLWTNLGRLALETGRNRLRRLRGLHADEEGMVSVLAVFGMLFLAMLFGMVANNIYDVDAKMRMQHTADAVALSGGNMMARNLNGMVFTNHLTAETMALTAFLREAQAREAEKFVPRVLQAWLVAASHFRKSGWGPFMRLAEAIPQRAQQEQQLVSAFMEWSSSLAGLILPTMEQVLAEEMIPEYQLALQEAAPTLVARAAEASASHSTFGTGDAGGKSFQGFLWRTSESYLQPVGPWEDQLWPSLPVIPLADEPLDVRKQQMIRRRNDLARVYLNLWNMSTLASAFSLTHHEAKWNDSTCKADYYREGGIGKMTGFYEIWGGFTCGHLNDVIQENTERNLPMVLRTPLGRVTNLNQHIDDEFSFIGIVYSPASRSMMPGLFKSPIEGDQMTFAQVRVFPQGRSGAHSDGQSRRPLHTPIPHFAGLPSLGCVTGSGVSTGMIIESWSLLNQRWTVKLVPAIHRNLPLVLSAKPPAPLGDPSWTADPINTGSLTIDQLSKVNHH